MYVSSAKHQFVAVTISTEGGFTSSQRGSPFTTYFCPALESLLGIPYENEKWAAHVLPTEAVGSSVDRSCPLFMYTHYNICPWAAHCQLSRQELPTNFQSLYNIWPWAAHRQLRLLDYIVGSSVGSSNLNAEKVVGSGQLQHRFSICLRIITIHSNCSCMHLGKI